jgi:tetratricopeptide (TPR) repeat protein
MQDAAEICTAKVMLANCLKTMGHLEEALAIYEVCLKTVQGVQGNSDLVRVALHHEAGCLLHAKRFAQAVSTYQEVGALYREMGNLDKGEEALRSALHCQQLLVQSLQRESSSALHAGGRSGEMAPHGDEPLTALSSGASRKDIGLSPLNEGKAKHVTLLLQSPVG